MGTVDSEASFGVAAVGNGSLPSNRPAYGLEFEPDDEASADAEEDSVPDEGVESNGQAPEALDGGW